MNYKIKIQVEDEVKKYFSIDFRKKINKLLTIIPKEHLINLDKIKITYYPPNNKGLKKAEGFYMPRGQGHGERANITLCLKNILADLPEFFFKVFPFFLNSFIADVLYHEIGHHYRTLSYGIKDKIMEKYAEKYSLKMKRKYFHSYGIGKIIYKIKLFFPR